MHGIAVALLSEDRDRLPDLQGRVEATRLGRVVFSNIGFPSGPTDLSFAKFRICGRRSLSSIFPQTILPPR